MQGALEELPALLLGRWSAGPAGADESRPGRGPSGAARTELCGKSAVRLMQQVRVYQSVLTKPQLAKRCTLRQRAANKAGRDTNLCSHPATALQHLLDEPGDVVPVLWGRTRGPQQVRLGEAPGQHWPFSLVFLALHFGWCFPQLAPSLLLEGGAFVPVSGKAQHLQELGSWVPVYPAYAGILWKLQGGTGTLSFW